MKFLASLVLLFCLSFNASAAMVYDADEAFCDSFGRVCGDGHAVLINNKKITGDKNAKQFTIVDDFAFLNIDNDDGVLMARISNGIKTYDLYAEFNDISDATNPRKQLKRKAYVEKGGPVDTSTWTQTTNTVDAGWSGYLLEQGALDDGYQVGLDAAAFEFSLIGPGFLLGTGANGKNVSFGASARLQFFDITTGKKLGKGDINLDLTPQPVPLPDSMPLFLSATAGLFLVGGTRKKY